MSFLIYGYDTIKQCHVRGKNVLMNRGKKAGNLQNFVFLRIDRILSWSHNDLWMMLFESPLRIDGQSIAKPVYLLQSYLLQFIRCIRPVKRVPVKAFHQYPETRSIPLEYLDRSASAIAECEHAPGIRIQMEFQFDDSRQTMVALPQVSDSAGQ